jgi:DNA polymerase-3 subunit beta
LSSTATASDLAVTLSRADWLSILTAANRVAKNYKPLPVLGCVLLTAESGGLMWWATDTVLWRSGTMAAEATGEGLVSAELALALVKRCPEGLISLRFDGDRAVLKAGAFTAKLPTFPLEDFPARPQFKAGGAVFPAADLARVVEIVSPCIREDSPQHYERGAKVTLDARALTACALDGHRMARAVARHTRGKQTPEVEDILPKCALVELAAMITAQPTADVNYQRKDGQHALRVGTDLLVTRGIDAKFPDITRVIPKESPTRFVVDRNALLLALQRIVVVMEKTDRGAEFSLSGDSLRIVAASALKGESEEFVPVTLTGDELKFRLNPGYALDALNTMTSELVAFELGKLANVVIRPIEQDGPDQFALISPMVL